MYGERVKKKYVQFRTFTLKDQLKIRFSNPWSIDSHPQSFRSNRLHKKECNQERTRIYPQFCPCYKEKNLTPSKSFRLLFISKWSSTMLWNLIIVTKLSTQSQRSTNSYCHKYFSRACKSTKLGDCLIIIQNAENLTHSVNKPFKVQNNLHKIQYNLCRYEVELLKRPNLMSNPESEGMPKNIIMLRIFRILWDNRFQLLNFNSIKEAFTSTKHFVQFKMTT